MQQFQQFYRLQSITIGVYHMQQSVANMKGQDYQNSITSNLSSREVCERITQVSRWWAKDFEGKSQKLNDVFTVRFKSGDRYTLKVSEMIPDKKIVWSVIDAYQGWNSRPTEWVGTKIVWEIVSREDGNHVLMTHLGLVPTCECFEVCHKGWDYLITKSLEKLLNEDNGMPV